ncbi:MAG: methyltransferase domain-containing protein [Herminiimonas sp.]|uniref:class I SAM-dependent methyltransferase n=1 Tax=Herminiimonas sp. TaxID=1926289 RepID=UPI00271ED182|nr:methyltransferase domain-containing protein [Herminiimonas sp.]MDO9419800.1 methyltransferase domain-containing protein [Herminiimonas sp.]
MSAYYCCTEVSCNHASLREETGGLQCSNGHFFPYSEGTKVPLFAFQKEDVNEYALKDAANIHDNSLRWVFKTFGTDEDSLRTSLIARLGLSKGQTILITGAGAGNDLPYIAERLGGSGVIYAQDIAKQMLLAGVERHAPKVAELGIDIHFSCSDATNLPFAENVFDAAYHFGGLNLFPDIKKGIAEMNRVVKPGGKIVISDEGCAPWLKSTEIGKMLIKNNSLYDFDAPLTLLPETAHAVNLSWEVSNCFFVIDFIVSENPPYIDIDVPHVGKRGGSIRSRYLGQLEGVNPALKDRLYAEAERQGISRVELLERLLEKGCS